MITTKEKPSTPNDDKRWRIIETTMRRNNFEGHALIETLHSVQEWFGYIDDDAMTFVAERLNLPLSKVYGVATFYHFFTLKPPGKHTCLVCLGTACYIKGGDKLIKAVSDKYGIKAEETTEDGEISLMSARCIGACGLAPAVVIDGNVQGKIGEDKLIDTLEGLKNNDA